MTTTNDRAEKQLRALRTLLRAGEGRALPQVKSDINVTPLVDVVLVLLIIFMVVTPLIASGVLVDLPRTLHHSRKPDEGKDIIVSVTRDSHLYVGASRVARPEDVAQAVRMEKRRSPQKAVFLKGDALAPYGAVREIMQALHGIEIEDVVLGTQESKREAP